MSASILVGTFKREELPLASADSHLQGARSAHSNRGGSAICKVNAEAATRSIGYHPRMRGKCLEGRTLTGGQRSIKLALTFIIDPKNVNASRALIAKGFHLLVVVKVSGEHPDLIRRTKKEIEPVIDHTIEKCFPSLLAVDCSYKGRKLVW